MIPELINVMIFLSLLILPTACPVAFSIRQSGRPARVTST